MRPQGLGAAALVVAAAAGPLALPSAVAAPAAAATSPDSGTDREGEGGPGESPRAPYPRSVGLPAAVALVALGGSAAALLRVLRSEPPRPWGYAEDARREHPPVTERP